MFKFFLAKKLHRSSFLFIFLALFFIFASSGKAEESLHFIHQDHLSSTNIVTNKDGEAVSRQNYYPYGSTRTNQGSIATERQYTSQVSDQDQTGLYYYNARYYDPRVGIFTQSDPLGVLNKYAYAKANPINMLDSTGNDEKPAWWDKRFPLFPLIKNRDIINVVSSAHSFIPKQIAKANIPIVSDIAAWDVELANTMDEFLFNKAWDANTSFDDKMWYVGEIGGKGMAELTVVGGGLGLLDAGKNMLVNSFNNNYKTMNAVSGEARISGSSPWKTNPPNINRIDVGGGTKDSYFKFGNNLTINIDPIAKPHIIADGNALPFANNSVSDWTASNLPYTTLSQQSLWSEANRVVRPGGAIFYTGLYTQGKLIGPNWQQSAITAPMIAQKIIRTGAQNTFFTQLGKAQTNKDWNFPLIRGMVQGLASE